MSRSHHRWSSIDWSRPSSDIAHQLGVTLSAVSKARKKHAPHTLRGYRNRTTPHTAPTQKPTYTVLQAINRDLSQRLDKYHQALTEAHARITDLHDQLLDAQAKAHTLERERDALRRDRERLTGHPQPTTTSQPPPTRPPHPPAPDHHHVDLDALQRRLGHDTYQLLRAALEHHPDLAPMIGTNPPDADHDLQPGRAELNFHHLSAGL